ncbi:MAG TPA: family 14 glycosylhydrolase [Candidatus Hydrogenedentes bacterium]|nr:family 14 glycosylhydrolase [Candidatus Hydrogenedentota bacterium]
MKQIGLSTWFILCAVFPALANEIVFDAASLNTDNGIVLINTAAMPAIIREAHGEPAVGTPVNQDDYFSRRGINFRITGTVEGIAGKPILVVEYWDDDISLIEAKYSGESKDLTNNEMRSAQPLAGYTALGTEKKRRAVFQLEASAFPQGKTNGAKITLYGLSAITRLTLMPALPEGLLDAVKTEIPDRMDPIIQLSRPMDLVISVGEEPERMRDLCLLAARLGFNGIESYVRWGDVEKEKGNFDWSHYDAIVNEAQRHGLKWLPLLIVGSAYTLPQWFHDSPENIGFQCLEHHQGNNIQTIFCENQTPYVKRFLQEFGKHYEPMNVLLAVRLGPSGNYGESQYPAGGNWGYKGKQEHIHIGWWMGDQYAAPHFRRWLENQYGSLSALNDTWSTNFQNFDEVQCGIPQFFESPRIRKDTVDWYIDAMTEWCERWAVWAREAMPNTYIYQSSGGWGFVESGTDFAAQTKSMKRVNGGIRATNETDSYVQNFEVTRMMSSAARFYGVGFGSEPASSNTAKGFAARLYNLLVNNGRHFFQYGPNLTNYDQTVPAWRALAPLMDRRAEPFIEVAVLYPDTLGKLDDGVFRNLYSSSFYPRVAALRSYLDFDFCSEQMVLDGALPRYKALIFLWSHIVEQEVLDAIDAWVQEGGTIICPYWSRTPVINVEGNSTTFNRWLKRDTGKGKALLFQEDREPVNRYADGVYQRLLTLDTLAPQTQSMLRTQKPAETYMSALQNGVFALLNYTNAEATAQIPDKPSVSIPPYRFIIVE